MGWQGCAVEVFSRIDARDVKLNNLGRYDLLLHRLFAGGTRREGVI